MKKLVSELPRHKVLSFGLLLLVVVVFAAIGAELLAPFDPAKSDFRSRLAGPSAAHWFGTDSYGRDILSRVIHGGRVSLRVGFAVVVLNGLLGTFIGAVSGYYRRLDPILMRVMDGLMAFPAILIAIALAAMLGPSETSVVVALSIAYMPRTARVVRSSVLTIREADYVQAAKAIGASDAYILIRCILLNSIGPTIVQLTFVFALAVLAEAVLSFIGVGPPPPTPTWGNVIADGRNYIREAPWITIVPGLAIFATVLAVNLVGDGLRDILDPRLRDER